MNKNKKKQKQQQQQQQQQRTTTTTTRRIIRKNGRISSFLLLLQLLVLLLPSYYQETTSTCVAAAAATTTETTETSSTTTSTSTTDTMLVTTTTPETTTTMALPYLVVCTVDGTIIVLDAQDGGISCMFTSGVALVGPSSRLPSGRRIVPGLDGRLYVTPIVVNDNNNNNNEEEEKEEQDDEDDDDDEGAGGFLTPLDITVLDVLQNPVKTCSSSSSSSSEEETDCGIVTGTKSTSLFALDASSGLLVWHQSPNGSTTRYNHHYHHHHDNPFHYGNNDDDDDATTTTFTTTTTTTKTVLLQREDILVKQISTDSGKSVWNVTLGTFQALEFGTTTSGTSSSSSSSTTSRRGGEGEVLPAGTSSTTTTKEEEENDDDTMHNHSNNQQQQRQEEIRLLPHVMFGPDGTTLSAVDPTTNAVLWKQDFATVVASVFGLSGKSWKPLTVLEDDTFSSSSSPPSNNDERDGDHHHHHHHGSSTRQDYDSQLSSSSSPSSSGLTIYRPPTYQQFMASGDRYLEHLDWMYKQSKQSDGFFYSPLASSSSSSSVAPYSSSNKINNNNNNNNNDCLILWPLVPPSLASRRHYGSGGGGGYFYNNGGGSNDKDDNLYALSSWKLRQQYQKQQQICRPTNNMNEQLALPSPADDDDGYDYDDIGRFGVVIPNKKSNSNDIRSDGLFLTWPVIVAILSLSVVLIQKFYEYKKRQWYQDFEEKAEMTLTATSTDITQGLIEPPEGSTNKPLRFFMHNQKVVNLKKSISMSNNNAGGEEPPQPPQVKNTSIVVFQHSNTGDDEGLFGNQDHNENNMSSPKRNNSISSSNQRSGTVAATTSPTLLSENAAKQQQQGVGFLMDGIPLIRYSRYESEFKEIMALGKGGFGTVFQCQNVLDGREYAIKKICLKSDSSLPPQQFQQRLRRTLREVKSLALLDHPHVVRYYTAWLELDNNNDDLVDNAVAAAGASDYYLFSSPDDYDKQFTRTNKDKSMDGHISKNERFPNWRRPSLEHLRKMTDFNPLGGWNGNQFGGDEEEVVFSNVKGVPLELDEYGFTFERSSRGEVSSPDLRDGETTAERSITDNESKSDKNESRALVKCNISDENYQKGFFPNNSLASVASSIEESQSMWSKDESRNPSGHLKLLKNETDNTVEKACSKHNYDKNTAEKPSQSILVKHFLYIQMQFCSQKTLADFLSNEEARKGLTGGDSVDIPYALSLFLQIAQGVRHVHLQGLIHRDLKPNNCFIDDAGVVKVGDFGLSRESGETRDEDATMLSENEMDVTPGDITAGVGTRSYASPEQMQGGDYDSSTDVYSLGIMLFELCYPMYTGMERHIVMSNLRNHMFPDHWLVKIKPAFPNLHTLLLSMISNSPADRPTAQVVAQSIQAILEKMTISSLDQKHQHEGAILLRVEAKPRDDVLRHTIELLKDTAAPAHVNVLQYGLKGGTNEAIMEFAIGLESSDGAHDDISSDVLVDSLVSRMSECPDIILIRQVFGEKWRKL